MFNRGSETTIEEEGNLIQKLFNNGFNKGEDEDEKRNSDPIKRGKIKIASTGPMYFPITMAVAEFVLWCFESIKNHKFA